VTSPSEPIEFGEDPTALYRLYGHDSELLYVGITEAPARRMAHHADTQPWWPEVVRKTMAWYPTRSEADEAETAAIDAEKPKYNLKKSKDPGAARRALAAHLRTPRIKTTRSATLEELQAVYKATGVMDLGSMQIHAWGALASGRSIEPERARRCTPHRSPPGIETPDTGPGDTILTDTPVCQAYLLTDGSISPRFPHRKPVS
jgi:predicted GIY-YIG superfamily endonuclease